MRQQIVDLINERGEMTFRELCCELNMFSRTEVDEMDTLVSSMISGVDECTDCKGDGSIECTECDGKKTFKCDNCDGKGTHDCPDCDASGSVECDMGHEHDCEECNGRGKVTCDECKKGIVTCGSCNGLGVEDCCACDATGEVDSELPNSINVVGPTSLIGSSIITRALVGIH